MLIALTDTVDHVPVACSLTPEQLNVRSHENMEVLELCLEVQEQADGWAFCFPGEAAVIDKVTHLILAERACCRFFTFELRFEPDLGPLWLRIHGPTGSKEMFDTVAQAVRQRLHAHGKDRLLPSVS